MSNKSTPTKIESDRSDFKVRLAGLDKIRLMRRSKEDNHLMSTWLLNEEDVRALHKVLDDLINKKVYSKTNQAFPIWDIIGGQ